MDSATFLQENKGLIESLANKFYLDTPKFSKEDLLQEANLAAIRALKKFDPTKNKSKLTTYVYSAVHRSCRDFVRANKNDLYITNYRQTKDWKEAQVAAADNPVPIGEGPLPKAKFASIESPMAIRSDEESPNGDSFGSTIPSGDAGVLEGLVKKEQVTFLMEEIDLLPARERDIIMARWFDGAKLADIARSQGVTRQRIDQISRRAMDKLKEKVQERLEFELFV